MLAKDVMTPNVITVDENTPVQEIARTLLEWRISAVPVLDSHETVVGIVSEGDLMHRPESGTDRPPPWWLSALTEHEQRAIEFAKSHGHVAKDVMTKVVVMINEEASLAEIAQTLEEHRIKRVPVVRGSKLVGIVSRANLLHGLATAELASTPSEHDSQLRATIMNTLRNESGLRLESLNITASKGVVHLWGTAVSEAQKDAIRVAAEGTVGVAEVKDHLTILPEMFRRWLSEKE